MHYAIDFYSGYIEDVLGAVGSRDITLVERFLRLGEHTQMVLGLPDNLMTGWREAVEHLLMAPPKTFESPAQTIALLTLLRDAGQRRFRIFAHSQQSEDIQAIFTDLGHPSYAGDLFASPIAGFSSPTHQVSWGFLDVNQVEQLLLTLFGDDSFRTSRTAAIAGRLSNYARHEAERALLEVGIETQNSVSHNIDYLIIGSKGTGGTKHDKVQALQGGGHRINVLDEEGFDRLVSSPRPPNPAWNAERKACYENLVRALRHVWAFDLDLYCLTYAYDPQVNTL